MELRRASQAAAFVERRRAKPADEGGLVQQQQAAAASDAGCSDGGAVGACRVRAVSAKRFVERLGCAGGTGRDPRGDWVAGGTVGGYSDLHRARGLAAAAEIQRVLDADYPRRGGSE